jgi:Divergent InlB B-repeat domain
MTSSACIRIRSFKTGVERSFYPLPGEILSRHCPPGNQKFDPGATKTQFERFGYNGSNNIVESANKPAGGAWGAPRQALDCGRERLLGRCSVDGGGDTVAVWQRWNGSKYVVQAASKPADGAWASAVDLSTATASPFVNPEVALDGGGDAVAVWTNGGETAQASELDQRYLTVTESGAGAITSAPAGINCGSECLAAFAPGTEGTLSAATANGSEFKGWGGACSGTGPCQVSLSAAKSVSAAFAAICGPAVASESSQVQETGAPRKTQGYAA